MMKMKMKMKILIWGNKIFSTDMQWGFEQAGCDAKVIHVPDAKTLQYLLEKENPELLMTLGAPTELRADALELVGKRELASMKYIHWDTDGISITFFNSASGDGIEMDVIYRSKPDLVLTMCPEMRDFILSKDYPCEMMHFAYSPISHCPLDGYDNEQYYINLIGNSYSQFYLNHSDHCRYKSIQILLKPLLTNGYQVHFYGDTGYRPLIKAMLDIDVPEAFFHQYLPYERTCATYNSSFINLVTQNHEHTITKRTFEILGSGGCALSYDNAALRELFAPGRDLAVSNSPEQTLGLVKYYKENKAMWQKVRANAVKSVDRHTYRERARYILDLYQNIGLGMKRKSLITSSRHQLADDTFRPLPVGV